jgi:hypothetical protein
MVSRSVFYLDRLDWDELPVPAAGALSDVVTAPGRALARRVYRVARMPVVARRTRCSSRCGDDETLAPLVGAEGGGRTGCLR